MARGLDVLKHAAHVAIPLRKLEDEQAQLRQVAHHDVFGRGERADGNLTLSSMAHLHLDDSLSVLEQFCDVLERGKYRHVDLFHSMIAVDGNVFDRHLFCAALQGMGYQASQEDIEAIWTELDTDHSGTLEYEELDRALEAAQHRLRHTRETRAKLALLPAATRQQLEHVAQPDRQRGRWAGGDAAVRKAGKVSALHSHI